MKKLFVLVTLIVCGAAIFWGNLHWNKKISAQSENVTSTEEKDTIKGEPKKEEKEIEVSAYYSSLPKASQKKINNAAISGNPLQLVIYGATSNLKGAWPEQFSKELKDTYGENIFEVTVLSTDDKTTREVVLDKSYEEINELKPDILLYEPSMLKDNGLIGINNTLNNIETMIDSWEVENKGMILMIQPPNPLYSADYYPSEVSQLKDYAEKNDIIYINHWENWPDLEDIRMRDYLMKFKPNERGNEVWAEYLINYFISK